MSFIKIKDPRKREELIKDLIETRKRIKDNFIARKVGESEYQTGLTKLFKPITETQKATAKEITEAQKEAVEKITSGLLPIKEGVKELPLKLSLGKTAVKNLKGYFRKDKSDMVAGIRDEEGSFKIGSEPILIKNNDIIINGDEYKGTPGLWKLITSKNIPDISEYTPDDLHSYIEIMSRTNTIREDYDPLKRRRGGNNRKMNDLIKPFVRVYEDNNNVFTNIIKKHFGIETETDEETDDEYGYSQPPISGTGLTILPNDPNALIDRFDLLLASQNAGHSGVRNELVSILDFLKRQGVINMNTYKKLNSIIRK